MATLNQWFSLWPDFAPRETFGNVWRCFSLSHRGEGANGIS